MATWMDVREHFSGRPTDDAAVTAEQVEAMAASMAAFFARTAPDRTFALPEDYRRWLPHLGRYTNRGGTYGFTWYDPQTVVANTIYGCETFDNFPMERRRIWLEIAHWSDKHDIFLCCDANSPQLGWLCDSHDDHFWLSPENLHVEASSLSGYLRRLHRPVRRERRARRKQQYRDWLAAHPPADALPAPQ